MRARSPCTPAQVVVAKLVYVWERIVDSASHWLSELAVRTANCLAGPQLPVAEAGEVSCCAHRTRASQRAREEGARIVG